jgi:hypothetical protein
LHLLTIFFFFFFFFSRLFFLLRVSPLLTLRSGEELASLVEGACDYFHDGLDTPIDRAIDLRIIAFSGTCWSDVSLMLRCALCFFSFLVCVFGCLFGSFQLFSSHVSEKCFMHFKDALSLRDLASYDDFDVERIRAEMERETSDLFFDQSGEYDRKRFAETVYKV